MFQMALVNEEICMKIIDLFPYPIQIYAADGTSVMVNQALLNLHNINDISLIVGRYNVFEDPLVVKYGILDEIKRVFKGESIHLTDIKFPVDEIVKLYEVEGLDIESLYHDITSFPVFDDRGIVNYVVSMMIERRVYKGKAEIIQAKEYIERHWIEPFDLLDLTQRIGLSKSHFTRLFKKHVACTPHDYYMNLKIVKIKEKLLDKSISISQSFSLCGVDYNGHFAKVFKTRTGLTPTEYRRTHQ